MVISSIIVNNDNYYYNVIHVYRINCCGKNVIISVKCISVSGGTTRVVAGQRHSPDHLFLDTYTCMQAHTAWSTQFTYSIWLYSTLSCSWQTNKSTDTLCTGVWCTCNILRGHWFINSSFWWQTDEFYGWFLIWIARLEFVLPSKDKILASDRTARDKPFIELS